MIAGFAVSLACAVAAVVALFGVLAVVLPGRPQPWPVHLTRRTALLAGLSAAAVYTRGLSVVAWSEHQYNNGANSVPAPACRDGFPEETVQHLSHHQSSYLPLRFDCVLDDGTVYSSNPGYVWMNWTSLSLALSCALLVIGMGRLAELRARKEGQLVRG
ncbi:hypothetical protein [Streptomyces triticisoli]|jgi:hypothetical protein|uniref:hypothetical protein n=1 Tax=Streptomyces triticisoli TaxID=2182797 RepID=UPI000DD95C7B|nr:hypothetical protein [Streptomyces triticisoli]